MTIENCTAANTESVQIPADEERDDMLKYLADKSEICFKSQQIWEADLTNEEKYQIGLDLFESNKLQFLMKFGKYLNTPQLIYFKRIVDAEHNEEMDIIIADLTKKSSETQNTTVKNRRYQAMLQMVNKGLYFSEIEMMKRNPLLYHQLIGQYLTADDIEERDRSANCEYGLVKILMDGIERDNADELKTQHENIERLQMEEESDDDIPNNPPPCSSTSHWGEIGDSRIQQKAFSSKGKKKATKITPEEQKLLKEEFITTMYESFLDGKDEDFEYENVDNDTSYDNIEAMENDEEEKYFNSESDEIKDDAIDDASSEDELDIFMKTLR
ncbi:unnamed protein product [Phyllotreta striolata]|uniref:CCD97-like C-terminal domain-containing protein n=1 Tax=Phyllotreta striolata TaxID=444603 RepID=A0A9N9TMH2_PHYSR|nr:unnamed protein product [Phyllotreta striolata]